MKNYLKRITVIGLALLFCTTAFAQIEKSDLKILYVGTNPDKPLSEREKRFGGNLERKIEFQKKRTGDFESLLKQYFNTVTVVFGDDYEEQISANYDVTIIDTYLKPLTKGGMVDNAEAGKQVHEQPTYLTEAYNYATIMIGEPSAFIGQGRQLKIDHLCLCLDAHAHGMKLDHPIFNTPLKVDISYEDVTLTGNYGVRYGGRNLGEKMPMWRMQTEGYRDGKGFPIGLVSTGYNFDNGIDAEWISSGTCDKGIEATAIGRHANFFHWGFAAAPEYMTEAAKLAFINAVHYIVPFKGAKQITRKIKGVQLKSYLREQQWTLSDEGSKRWLSYLAESDKKFNDSKKKVQAKKDAGEELSESDKMTLQMSERNETRAWTIRHEPQELKDKFGEDWAAYENYYVDNMDYFYPIQFEWYKTDVDADAKSLGIPNSSTKLLEKAITMLKKGDRTDMAKRILNRYTNESFETAKDWANWYNKNQKNIYFSEGDGYKFIVLP